MLKLYCNRGTATDKIVYWLVRKGWQVVLSMEVDDVAEWREVIVRAMLKDKIVVAKLQKGRAVSALKMLGVWVEIGKFI